MFWEGNGSTDNYIAIYLQPCPSVHFNYFWFSFLLSIIIVLKTVSVSFDILHFECDTLLVNSSIVEFICSLKKININKQQQKSKIKTVFIIPCISCKLIAESSIVVNCWCLCFRLWRYTDTLWEESISIRMVGCV